MNRLREENVSKLIVQYSLPSITVNVTFSLYLIALQFFIVQGTGLGDHAIAGMGICMPVMMLIGALGALTGAGSSSRISILLGQGNRKKACDVLGNAISLSLVISFVFLLVFFSFFDSLLHLIGATGDIFAYAKDFLILYSPCSVVLILSTCLSSVMRASGYPRKSMLIISLTVVLCLVLIFLFLYVLKWGLKGAALAIDIGSVAGLIPLLVHFLKKGSDLPIRMRSLKLNPHIVWLILNIGFSPFLISFSSALLAFIVNNRLSAYGGDVAIAAYTITNILTLLVYTTLGGLSQGIQPIIGYNYGAKRPDRVFKTVKIAGGSVVVIGLIGLLIAYFFAHPLVELFSPSPMVTEKAIFCLQTVSLGMSFSGLQMIIASFFQSTGFAGKGFFLNISRQFVFMVPLAFIFPVFWGVEGVWYSLPVSELLAVLLYIVLFLLHIKKPAK